MKKTFLTAFSIISLLSLAQNDAQNGDWKQRYVFKQNTSEAEYMIRYGDIDNLGYGWPEHFNPFTGKATPSHDWPIEQNDSAEINGFDQALVGTSFKEPDMGRDGYCGARTYLMDKYGVTDFDFKVLLKGLDTSKVKNVSLQIFVDDFQPREFGSKFEFYINKKRAPFAEKTLNALSQTGPIGKLITLVVPKEFIDEFKKDTVSFMFDDRTTGLGDGFAVDFFKILVNPKVIKTSIVKGTVYLPNGKPAVKATVMCGSQKVITAANGNFTLPNVPTGLALISVTTADKKFDMDFTVDVEEGQATTADLRIEEKPKDE